MGGQGARRGSGASSDSATVEKFAMGSRACDEGVPDRSGPSLKVLVNKVVRNPPIHVHVCIGPLVGPGRTGS